MTLTLFTPIWYYNPNPQHSSCALPVSSSFYTMYHILIYSIIFLFINLSFFSVVRQYLGVLTTPALECKLAKLAGISVCLYMDVSQAHRLVLWTDRALHKYFPNKETCHSNGAKQPYPDFPGYHLKSTAHHNWKFRWNLVTGTDHRVFGNSGDWSPG